MSSRKLGSKFSMLSGDILPAHFRTLKKSIKRPISLATFAEEGSGIAGILKRLELETDFSGCYVIIERRKPIYVGISRKVITRLRQHVKGRTHFEASLAYRMACESWPHKSTRNKAMTDGNFSQAFVDAQLRLRRCRCAYLRIVDPIERYLFEVFCAVELETTKWNTFETH